jgi:flagellar basal body rod protein FlgG
MNIGLYQSAAALSSLERWQDAVSQNITSAQVTGFKRRAVQVAAEAHGEILTQPGAKPDSGEGMAALFPQTRYSIAFNPGENNPTRRELDVALSGPGFFTVRKPDGNTAYTRAGELQIRADRTLVTAQGCEVLNNSGSPIQLSLEGGAIVVMEDGTVRHGENIVGKLGISKATNPARLISMASGLFLADTGANMVPVEKPIVQQGYLEGSNVSPLREMVDLVNISRAYEANQKLIQSRDGIMQKTLDAVS